MRRVNKCLFVCGAIFVFTTALNSFEALCKSDLKNSAQIPQQKNLPFKLKGKFVYKVKFNGIYMGKVECEYSGQQKLGNKLVDTINLSSNVKILKFLEIQSKEKLFIDSQTYLPLKVEREVKFFGRQEKIVEEYNQKENYVKITKSDAKGTKEETINLQEPIHNIIALLYFFPKDKELKLGESFSFALPTQKINIKVTAFQMVNTLGGSYEAYVLKGQPRKFTVWLERESRIALRIKFPVFLGRVILYLEN